MRKDDFESAGFKATLYKNSKTGEVVLAFKGTENLKDWQQNITQGLGKNSTHYEKAKMLAARLKLVYQKLEFTGHSLGGGMASAASIVSKQKATVFNAAAVHPNTVSKYLQHR